MPEGRRRIGVHTCPGGDQDSTHSADADHAELLPDVFVQHAGSFFVQLASLAILALSLPEVKRALGSGRTPERLRVTGCD